AGCAAARASSARGCDLHRLAPALPPHPDDHHGGDAGGAAARLRQRRRRRDAPAAWHLDRRWADREPGAHALHHPGDVPVPGSLRSLGEPLVVATAALRASGRAGAEPMTPCTHSPAARRHRTAAALALALALAAAGGCAVGPNYHRPAAPVP